MRRPLVTAAVIAALLATTACSGDEDPSAAAPTPSASTGAADDHTGHVLASPATGAATSPGRPATGNGAQVCAEALKTSSASAQVYVAELGKMLQATGAQDNAAAKEAEQRAATAIANWSTEMRKQSAQATDPQLKGLLAEIATEVGTMKADIASIEQNTLENLQQRLDQLCG